MFRHGEFCFPGLIGKLFSQKFVVACSKDDFPFCQVLLEGYQLHPLTGVCAPHASHLSSFTPFWSMIFVSGLLHSEQRTNLVMYSFTSFCISSGLNLPLSMSLVPSACAGTAVCFVINFIAWPRSLFSALITGAKLTTIVFVPCWKHSMNGISNRSFFSVFSGS